MYNTLLLLLGTHHTFLFIPFCSGLHTHTHTNINMHMHIQHIYGARYVKDIALDYFKGVCIYAMHLRTVLYPLRSEFGHLADCKNIHQI